MREKPLEEPDERQVLNPQEGRARVFMAVRMDQSSRMEGAADAVAKTGTCGRARKV